MPLAVEPVAPRPCRGTRETHRYASLSDDFYVTYDSQHGDGAAAQSRDGAPLLRAYSKEVSHDANFYCREKGDFVLEEDKDRGQYRWATIEQRRVCSGQVNPESVEEPLAQHELVLGLAPYMLSVSPLDCEALDLLFGFDFTYRGNHNQLVAEALGFCPAFEQLGDIPDATAISYEPAFTSCWTTNAARNVG